MRCFPPEKKKKKKMEKNCIFLVFLTVFSKKEEESRRPQKRKRAGTLNMFVFLLRLISLVWIRMVKQFICPVRVLNYDEV